jgi:hypothetical protein
MSTTRALVHAVQQLIDCLGGAPLRLGCPFILADASPGGIARLHAKVIPAARLLAPLNDETAILPPEVTPDDRELLARGSLSNVTWLTQGLAAGEFPDSAVQQQACELLCALSDMINVALAVVPPQPGTNRSSSNGGRSPIDVATAFMQLEFSGRYVWPCQASAPAGYFGPQWT